MTCWRRRRWWRRRSTTVFISAVPSLSFN